MADAKISQLPGVPVLAGSALIPITQSGVNYSTTASQIAALAGGGGTWGSITGTLSSQTDLQTALNNKLGATATAVSASVLATPRTINGVAFDGSANITINAVDSTARVPTTQLISTTAPLSGGGALSGDLTLSIGAASGSAAGTMSSADFTKLSGVATGATANSSDAFLLSRANHTGTQAGSTVTGAYTAAGMTMATGRFLGRITAATGAAEELTGTQATTLLDAFTSTLKGLVPASGGGTTNFLRADGTWAAPAGGGGSSPRHTLFEIVTDFTLDGATQGNGFSQYAPSGLGDTGAGGGQAANHPGVSRFRATGANGGITVNTDSGPTFQLGGNEVIDLILRPSAFTNIEMRVGLMNTDRIANAITNGVWMTFNGSGAVTGKTSNGGVSSTTATLATLSASTWYHLRMAIDSAMTSVTFTVFDDSGTSLGSASLTTNIPTTATDLRAGIVYGCSAAGTTTLGFVDYLRFARPTVVRGATT